MLTAAQERDAAVVAEYFGAGLASVTYKQPVVQWAHSNFRIPETAAPIRLEPVQICFLRFAFENNYTTWLYSTIKKSGKTAVSGLVGRYVAENSGPKAEVYYIANDKEQAKDRAYEAAKTSIELDPNYDRGKRVLPGAWKIIERQCVHEPTGSIMRAIASDYEGAAGGNPNISLWTEIWGMNTERMKRLWDEMTPVLTRKRSVRYVETYAGFVDESVILMDLYKLAVVHPSVRRVTREELAKYGGWPYADDPPFYVNEAARTFAYWDDGTLARRMPWQIGPEADAYYLEQETTLRPEAFKRLHLNKWVSSVQEFIPEAWYTRCASTSPTYGRDFPVVIGLDASVSNDCTAIVGVSRALEPDGSTSAEKVRTRFCTVFKPPKDGVIDYDAVEAALKDYCERYNVVQVAYDEYQLHHMMQKMVRDAVAWCKKFSQASDREIADKSLYDMIRDRKLEHNFEIATEYVNNCAAYVAVTVSKSAKIEKLRIVKKSRGEPIDPVVALSMAASECLRLNL